MRDTSVRQSVRIASDRAIVGYRRIGCAFPFSRKEGRISFSRMGRSWKKIRAPSKKLFSTRMAPPKGRPGKQSREIGPRDFHDIPLVFVRATAVEIISNEITNRNNAIEKLEKKSFSFFFFFFCGWKMKRGFGMVTNDSERVEWSREAIDRFCRDRRRGEGRDFSDTSIITLIKGWWIGRIGEIEGFTRVIWFNLRDGFCCLAAVNGIFGFVRYCG